MSHRRRALGVATWWLPALLLVAVVAACDDAGERDGLTVFAAASLRSVVSQLERAWLTEHPEAPLTVATEASNVLAAQIREGAPADVFLSADIERPQQLADAGHTVAEPVTFAGNRLALVAPRRADAITSPAELAEPGVRIVGISEGAPIARYTATAVEQIADTMPEPAAFIGSLEDNIVSREDNVRAALAKVELGEGDAAFVYATDARGSERVRAIPLPGAVDVMASYGAVQVSPRPMAAEFVAWLSTPTATAVLEAAGFEVAR